MEKTMKLLTPIELYTKQPLLKNRINIVIDGFIKPKKHGFSFVITGPIKLEKHGLDILIKGPFEKEKHLIDRYM
jgi:hypothetical protein